MGLGRTKMRGAIFTNDALRWPTKFLSRKYRSYIITFPIHLELSSQFSSSVFLTSPTYTMLSLRSFTRALPRSLPNLSAQCSRRTLFTVRRTSPLQQSWKLASRPRYAPFSTSRTAWEGQGEGLNNASWPMEEEAKTSYI